MNQILQNHELSNEFVVERAVVDSKLVNVHILNSSQVRYPCLNPTKGGNISTTEVTKKKKEPLISLRNHIDIDDGK